MGLRVNNLIGFGVKPAVSGETHDSYTSAIYHFDDATGLTDSSDFGNDLTANGNAAVSATQKKFGDKSLALDGTGDYGSIAATPSDCVMGTGDFTIDFWVYYTAVTAAKGLFSLGGFSAGIYSRTLSTSTIDIYVAGVTQSFAFTPSTATWYHYEFARSGTTLKFFVDGVQKGSDMTSSGNASSTSLMEIGSVDSGAQAHNGYLDEFRISKGIARHTTTFTPETGPYG